MAAYTSTQSGNFDSTSTWGGGGWPNLNGDTFTVAAGHTVTYNLTTPLNLGLGAGVVNSGGTFIMDTNTVIRFNSASTYHMAVSGNLIIRTGCKTLLKGQVASERIYDIRPLSFVPTTATGTSGQNTITVASNVSQIIVGNNVSGTGIAVGAYVTNIAGNVLTLSKNNTGTVSGNLTVGNYIEIIGSEAMPITTVNSAITSSQYQLGFIVATTSTGFVENDWIAVYKRGFTDAKVDRNDEGFIIHEISGYNFYIREFVGPTTTIISATTSTITVANSKIFRTWQRLIFGKGANRNILGITSINNDTNTITLNGTITGTVTGLSIYTTGPLKTKSVGDKIRKVATTLAADVASTDTQITLSSINGFSVGDEILIDAPWVSSYTDELPEKRNITAISGNIITINQSLGYTSTIGSFVTKVTRDIEFTSDYETTLTLSSSQSFAAGDIITQAYSLAKGVVKTATVNTTTVVVHDNFGQFVNGTTNSPWISKNGTPIAGNVYVSTISVGTTEGHSSVQFARSATFLTNQLPALYFRDVEVATFSNVSTSACLLYIRGFWSSNTNNYGGVEFEGITYCKPNQTDTFNYQASGILVNRYLNDFTIRCCVVWNAVYGIRFNESYDLRNVAAFNNYIARSETYGLYIEHFDTPSTAGNSAGGATEVAYNYVHRSDECGIVIASVRSPGRGIHHNWVNVTQFRPLQIEMTYTATVLYQNRFQSYFEPLQCMGSNNQILTYNEWIAANTFYDFGMDVSFQPNNYSITFSDIVYSLEHNYEYDAVTAFIPGGQMVWDYVESAWKCTFDNDTNVEIGLAEVFYIPGGVGITAKATIKLDPTFTGTAPKLEIRSCADRVYAGTTDNYAGSQPLTGFSTSTNFDATITDSYQTVELSLASAPWGRSVTIGVINVGPTSYMGWWQKPTDVLYDQLPSTPFITSGINNLNANYYNNAYFNQQKIRLGGRLT